MQINKNEYRRNVAAVVLANEYPSKCEIFLAKRITANNKPSWQFPQGGIDKNENEEEALLRELKEEIGTNEVEILATHPKWISYKFPKKFEYKNNNKMKNYIGQIQKYFLVRLKTNAQININTKKPEFSAYKFTDIKKVLGESSFVKRKIYSKVISYFKEQGYF